MSPEMFVARIFSDLLRKISRSFSAWAVPKPLISPRNRTITLMVLGLAGTVAAESWDARHEAAAVLQDLVQEQQLLGHTILAGLAVRPPGTAATTATSSRESICEIARTVEGSRTTRVVLELPNHELRHCGGGSLALESLDRAFTTGADSAVLSREEAVRLGLPKRTAVAGIVRPPGVAELTAVAVVSSAGPERDRSRHQQARTIVSMSAASLMILGFGLVVLRRQERELVLERQVELARVRQERDGELAKANRMATVAALASGFAHEIGTPLGIIAGRVEQLRSPNAAASSERRQEILTQVAQQVDRIGRLIRSFLALARGDAPMLVRARAGDVARNALRLVGHRFGAAGVHLQFDANGLEDSRLTCEPALFEQVIVNLLANALEASSPGQTVALALAELPEGLCFVVRDTGSGVSDAAVERVMEPFFTTKAGRGGTGLGLTIAREIVVHHRGELVIRKRTDVEGPGTEVTVRVPRVTEA